MDLSANGDPSNNYFVFNTCYPVSNDHNIKNIAAAYCPRGTSCTTCSGHGTIYPECGHGFTTRHD